MPKQGFKSLTMRSTVYDHFFDEYTKISDKLALQGITSFSGYVTVRLIEIMKKDKL